MASNASSSGGGGNASAAPVVEYWMDWHSLQWAKLAGQSWPRRLSDDALCRDMSEAALLEHKQDAHSSVAMSVLTFPMVALALGLLFDVLGKRAVIGRVRFPSSVFQFTIAMLFSALIFALLSKCQQMEFERGWVSWADGRLVSPELLLIILMPVLIFESAFKMSAHAFNTNRRTIVTIAFSCYIWATLFHGGVSYIALASLGVRASEMFIYAAMVSATDPVAVVALLEDIGAPFGMRTVIEGESLLNDGIAIVGFKVFRLALRTELLLVANYGEWWLPLRLVAGVVGSALIGCLLGYVFVFFVAVSLPRHRQQHCANLLLVYLVYYVADTVLNGSGVLSVVCFGLTMSYFRHYLHPDMVAKTNEIWEFLGYWANCIVFILAGYSVGKVMGGGSFDTIVLSLLLAPVSVAARALFMCAMFTAHSLVAASASGSGRRRGRQPENITHYLCYTWGGLRGALPLLLSFELRQMQQHVATTGMAPQPLVDTIGAICLRNLILCSGTVFASLLIQGLTFELLTTKVGLKRRSEHRKTMERQIMDEIRKDTVEKEISKWKSEDWSGSFAGVNWQKIDEIMCELFAEQQRISNELRPGESKEAPPPATQQQRQPQTGTEQKDDEDAEHTQDESVDSVVGGRVASQFYVRGGQGRSAGDTAANSAGTQSHGVDSNGDTAWQQPLDESSETQKAYYRILQAEVWQMWKRGILSPSSVQHLITAFDHCIDIGTHHHPLFWKCIINEQGWFDRVLCRVAHECQRMARFSIRTGLLQERPRDHAKSEDWCNILLTILALVEAVFAVITVTNHMTEYATEWYIVADMLFCTIFFLEQFFRLVNRHMRKRYLKTRRNKLVLLLYCYTSMCYLFVAVLLGVAIWPEQSNHLHPNRMCYKRESRRVDMQVWRYEADAPGYCQFVRWTLLVLPSLNALIKLVLALPVLVYLLGEWCDDRRRSLARVTLGALDALRHITQSVELDRYMFITDEAYKRARIINMELSNAADRKLAYVFNRSSEFADVMHVLRTRRTARTALFAVRDALHAKGELGLIAHDDTAHIKLLIDKATGNIDRMSWVMPPSVRAQVEATAWLQQCVNAKQVTEYIVGRLLANDKQKAHEAPKRCKRESTLHTGNRLWFLHQGIAMVTNSPYAKREISAEAGHNSTTDIRFAGSWINEGTLIDDEMEPASVYMVTRCKLYYLRKEEMWRVEQLAASVLDEIRSMVDIQRVHWQLRHKAGMQRLTNAQLRKCIANKDMYIRSGRRCHQLVEPNKALVVIRGRSYAVGEPRHAETATPDNASVWRGPNKVAMEPHGAQPLTYVLLDESDVQTDVTSGSMYQQSVVPQAAPAHALPLAQAQAQAHAAVATGGSGSGDEEELVEPRHHEHDEANANAHDTHAAQHAKTD